MGAAASRVSRHAEVIDWNGHAGPALGHASGYDIIACTACGFRHAVPLPTPEALEAEYAEAYYRDAKPTYLQHAGDDQQWAELAQNDRLDAIGRAISTCHPGRSEAKSRDPEGPSARLAAPGSRVSDASGGLARDDNPKRPVLIEIGSGPGFFLDAAEARGWRAIGVEPSRQAAAFAQARGRDVRNMTFSAAIGSLPPADAIAATNVLEHIPDPIETLAAARDLLKAGGVICVTVPNDFSPMQMAAERAKGQAPWWIAPPHHLNYFNFDSLESLLTRVGFAPRERLTSFPMEAFLLMGDDYVCKPETGRALHARRMSFDLSFETAGLSDARRSFYSALAAAGLGREATVVAVKT